MAFTFAAFCYMLALLLTAALIFFAIWHVSILIKLWPNWGDFEHTDTRRIVTLIRHTQQSANEWHELVTPIIISITAIIPLNTVNVRGL